MATIRRTFVGGKMDKDTDERLIPDGDYRDAQNIEVINSEGSDVGSVQNSFSNRQLTSLDFGDNVYTLSEFEDKSRNKLYWHVKSDSGCYLLEWDDNSQSVSYVLKDTRIGSERVLDLDENYLITGLDKIINDNVEDDLFLWTDNNMEICCINIERAKKYGENGFDIEDITLIKRPPRFAPTTALMYNGKEGNNIEEKFPLFAYRYQYLDNEWSVLSSFTNSKFNPKPYEIDYYTLDNIGMVNAFNAVNIGFDTGDKRVKAVQVITKEPNSNALHIIETFDKDKEGWADNSTQNFQFSNNKAYRQLPSSEWGRTSDNVPRKAGSLALVNNRLITGNILEGYNIVNGEGKKIKLDYNVSLKSIALNKGDDFMVAMSDASGNNSLTISNTHGLALKKDYSITFSINIAKTVTSINTIVYNSSFQFILDKDYANLQQLFLDSGFVSFTNIIINDFALQYDGVLGAGETIVAPPVLSVFTTGLNSVGFSVTPFTYDTFPVTTVQTQYLYFKNSTTVSLLEASSSASCKSNRDYEAGLVYYDTKSRETVTLTCANNSIYIPNEKSGHKNSLSVQINHPPPYFADRFKLVVKTPMLSYYSLAVNNFYIDGPFVWIKLEGSNIDKVKTGEYLILKSKFGEVQDTIIKTKILEISQKEKDFISTTPTVEPAGSYMKIKPNGFNMKQEENEIYSDTQSHRSMYSFPTVYLDLHTVDGVKQKLYPGNEIKLKFLCWYDYVDGRINQLFEQPYRIQREYNNVEQWFIENIAGNSLKGTGDGDYIDKVSVVVGDIVVTTAPNGIKTQVFTANPAGKEYMKVVGLKETSSRERFNHLDATVDIRVSMGDYIFETEPKRSVDQDLFFQTEQTFEVIDGNHQGNVQHQYGMTAPCIIDLDFFNCFAQGNGVESYQVKDAFNKPYLNIDTRPTSTLAEEYKEVRRLSDLSYSETYVESTNRNGLNEFNQSRGNYKELDKGYGAITKLMQYNNNVLVFQSKKVSQVLYEKDEIKSADGSSSLIAVDYVLGRQIPYVGENGCQHPESVKALDRQVYYANVNNGVIMRLANDGTDTIVKGMTSFFRNLFIERPNAKVLGGIDPYFNKYVVSVGDEPVSILELQCGNIISKHSINNAFTYHLKINELSGDIVLNYVVSGGNATIQALFDGNVTVVSNITGSGALTIPRTSLVLDIVAVTVTPVSGSINFEITNNCPVGKPLKVVSIVLGDSLDATKSITNRFKWGSTPYYETLDTFLETPLTRFTVENGTEGQGKFPLRNSTINIQSYSMDGQLGSFDIAKFNRLGYLISPTAYTEADIDTVLSLATFPTVTASVENISNAVNQASFNFAKTTDAQILYLIWDYTDRNIALANDAFTVNNAGTYIGNVLLNDTITGTPTVTILTAPTHGTAVVNVDKTITYVHDGTATLTDSYVYQVSTGIATATATVNITVNASGIPPATTYSFYYEGWYDISGSPGIVSYLDAYGSTQYETGLYSGECRLITAQSILSVENAGTCTVTAPPVITSTELNISNSTSISKCAGAVPGTYPNVVFVASLPIMVGDPIYVYEDLHGLFDGDGRWYSTSGPFSMRINSNGAVLEIDDSCNVLAPE